MDLGSVLGNAATGGVLGGLFSLGNAAVDFVNKRQEAKEELDKIKVTNDHDLAVLNINNDRARQASEEQSYATRLQGTIDEMKASFDGMTASITDQASLNAKTEGWVLDIVVLFRPGLTALLIVSALCTAFMLDKTAFNALVQLSAMAVTWWFGDRQRMKLLGK